jgi:hypothetical protein
MSFIQSAKALASLCMLAALTQAAGSEDPIRLHPDNPWYFQWPGRATVLVASGEHSGSLINPDFDFHKYLATMPASGLNDTRLFLGDYVERADSFETGLALRVAPVEAAQPRGAAVSQADSAASGQPAGPGFDKNADAALAAMRKRAGELGIGGVAVVAWFEGDVIQSWSSKMVVVGRHKDEPAGDNKGTNLLAIAYSKASEMADTLQASGSKVRPPMTGEFGWSGGVIVRGKTGYWIAAFSGGKSEDDVAVSQAGLATIRQVAE